MKEVNEVKSIRDFKVKSFVASWMPLGFRLNKAEETFANSRYEKILLLRNDWISGCNKGLWCNSLVSIAKTCWGWCERGYTGTRLLLLLAIGVKWDGRRSSPWSCKTAFENVLPTRLLLMQKSQQRSSHTEPNIYLNEWSVLFMFRSSVKLELWYRTLLRPVSLVRRYFRLYVRNSAKDFEKSQRGRLYDWSRVRMIAPFWRRDVWYRRLFYRTHHIVALYRSWRKVFHRIQRCLM